MAVPYTTGNWTVSREHLDSESTPKSITVQPVNWANDWTISSPPAGYKPQAEQETYLVSALSTGLTTAGSAIIRRDKRRNIYSNAMLEIDSSQQLPQRSGVYAGVSAALVYDAVNSVSGAECRAPLSGNLSIVSPTASMFTVDALYDFIGHLLGMMYKAVADTNPTLLTSVLRGDMNPLI
jgi:hypothetical protein